MPGRSDWQGEYRRRLMSAEDAMSLVGEDDLVKLHVGTPPEIAALLETRARSLDRLNVRALAPGYAPLLAGELESGELEYEPPEFQQILRNGYGLSDQEVNLLRVEMSLHSVLRRQGSLSHARRLMIVDVAVAAIRREASA